MSGDPITDAIELLRYAVYAALSPLHSAVFWMQATQETPLPFVIFQSQDAGGQSLKWLSSHGWAGLVTVRALAESQSAAEALYKQVAPGMQVLYRPGHSISAVWERPIVLPPRDGVWQSGGIWRVTID